MRKIIIILLLFAGIQAKAQFTLEALGTTYGTADTIPIGKHDTIPIRLLVVDTCNTQLPYYTYTSFAFPAYEVRVRTKYINPPGTMCVNCPNFWSHVAYLDDKKKPLDKCLEIWYKK